MEGDGDEREAGRWESVWVMWVVISEGDRFILIVVDSRSRYEKLTHNYQQ